MAVKESAAPKYYEALRSRVRRGDLSVTQSEIFRYRASWQLVNEARIQEIRRMSLSEKLRELEMLHEFGAELSWSSRRTDAEMHEQDCWRRLRELLNV